MKTTLSAPAMWLAALTCFAVTPLFAQAPPQMNRATSVAVIDINYIFKNHQRFKQTMDDIKKEVDDFEAYLSNRRTEITKDTEQLKNMPPGSAEYQKLEERLAGVHTSLQLETARKRKEILEREAKVYYNAYKDIEHHVALFADQHGFDLVLRYSSEEMDPTQRESVLKGVNRPIVFQRQLNITNAILNQLNRGTPPNRVSRGPQVPGRQLPPR